MIAKKPMWLQKKKKPQEKPTFKPLVMTLEQPYQKKKRYK